MKNIIFLLLFFFCAQAKAQHDLLQGLKVRVLLNTLICSDNSLKTMTKQYTYDACPVGVKPIMLIENIRHAKIDNSYILSDTVIDRNRISYLKKRLLKQLPTTYKCSKHVKVHVHRLFNVLDSVITRKEYCKIVKKIKSEQKHTDLKFATPPIAHRYHFLEMVSKSLSKIMENNPGYVGIDVSNHQKDIDWEKLRSVKSPFPIRFAIIKATEGETFKDKRFRYNWDKASANGFIRGAYHFYRPDANPYLQARNFTNQVSQLNGDDIIPIIDLEKPCGKCSDLMGPHFYYMRNLRIFVQLLKNHYKTKVLFYSNNNYYYNYIKGYFPEDYFWIARYSSNEIPHDLGKQTVGWQFTNRMRIPGIKTQVDTNYFLKDSFKQLQVSNSKIKK